jgi:hypothetical protein
MKPPKAPILTILLIFAWAISPLGASAGSPKSVVAELFTSEGCSSCPPADAFLRELDSQQRIDGTQVIVLEEHVDYWDGDGWRDPFSAHEFTERQAEYARRFRLDGPYTPQMVVNGIYEFVGSDRARVNRALQEVRASPNVAVRVSSAIRNGKLHAHIESDSVPERAEVWVVLALDHAESHVLHGENGGRHLEHVAVARKMSRIGTAEKSSAFSKDVTVDSVTGSFRMIVFVQEPGQGRILGATVEQVRP